MSRFATLLLVAVTLLSCTTSEDPQNAMDGVWQSIGSGRVLLIEDGTYTLYDLTRLSCLPVREAPVEEFGEAIQVDHDTLTIRKGIITYYYTRISRPPDLCTRQLPPEQKADPLYNFDVFTETIKAHYAFFELNGICWDSLYKQQRDKLSSASSEAELYLVLEETQQRINDNHGYLEATDDVYRALETLNPEPPPDTLREYGDFEVAQLAARHFLKEDMTEDSWLIQWGKTDGNTGYVQVKAMWLYADLPLSDSLVQANGYVDTYVEAFHRMNEGQYIEREKEGVSRIMTRVMRDLSATDHIIVDVRFNGGGQDAVSLEILRYFNDQKRRIATQQLRYGDRFSPPQPIYLEASANPYLKSVYVLTSRQTGSAAETFALATMSLPHVHRIGAPTAGALSTALEKRLPNGWPFALSNEIIRDNNGVFYESRGIPVDHALDYPPDRQAFFRSVAGDLEGDKQRVLQAISEME